MTKMINLKNFLKENDIEFESDKKCLRWVRSLKPNTLVRIGSSFFIEEEEIKQLMQTYLNQQIALRKKRAIQAKKNFTKRKIRRNINPEKIN